MNTSSAVPVMLVTGGNTGIGLETVIGLAHTGARVIFTARDPERGAHALAEARERTGRDSIEVMALDLASFASIRSFAASFLERTDRLDVFVANAGLAPSGHRWETEEGFEAAFGVNHLGHFLLTQLLVDRLVASAPSRVVVVSSGAHRVAVNGLCFDDLQHEREFHSMQVYGESKLANIYFASELARRLAGTGVTVNALNPGYVATQLGSLRPEDAALATAIAQAPKTGAAAKLSASLPPPMSPAEGARTTLLLALAPALAEVTGAYFAELERIELGAVASDALAAQRLWALSEAMVDAHPA